MRFVILLVGCSPLRASFECRDSAMCGSGGVCEATGFCSFSDGNCGGGRRYGHLSGALADLCIDAVDGGVDGGGTVYRGCALAIGGGGTHACAIVDGGSVECWGDGVSLPAAVLDAQSRPLVGASLALGGAHSCSLSAAETLSCWGANDHGQLGTGAPPSPQPVPALLGLNPVKRVASGDAHMCASVGDAHLVWCWGRNDDAQLSDGSSADAPQPQAALAPDNTQLAAVDRLALGRAHSCALIAGHLTCWGSNAQGQLGSSPPMVTGLGKVLEVAAGGDRTCAIVEGGSVWCWGAGQPLPTQVAGVTASAIAVAADHACAANGTVVCWGAQPEPVRDLDGNLLTEVVEIVAGAGFSCARTSGGAVLCWGASAVLGDGSSVDRAQAGAVRLTCP